MLDDTQIRETVRRYILEQDERFHDGHLLWPPRDGDEAEAHTGLLLDEMRGLQANLSSSNFTGQKGLKADYEGASFSGDVEAKVCELFELDPATTDRSDLQFVKACHELTRATFELYAEHVKRIDGEPTASQQPYLSVQPFVRPQEQPQAGQKAAGPLVSELLGPFLHDREKRKGTAETTVNGYRQFVQTFIDIEDDLPVGAVTPAMASDFRDKLQAYPSNRTKRQQYRDKSPQQLLAMDIPEEDRLSKQTINNHLVHLSTYFGWLTQRQHIAHNPFKELELKSDSESYPPWSVEDMELLFSSELYAPDSKYFRAKTTTAGHWWLPLLAIYSGARMGELVQMRLENIGTVDGVVVASIRGDKEKGQRVKTAASARDVPIHPRLLELGFEEYLAQLRVKRATRVLEGVKLGKDKPAAVVTKWFGRYKEAHLPGFKESGKVLHSARSNFYTAALNAPGASELDVKALVGHSLEEKLGAGVHYYSGRGAMALFDVVAKIDYQCTALNNLGQDWRKLNLTR